MSKMETLETRIQTERSLLMRAVGQLTQAISPARVSQTVSRSVQNAAQPAAEALLTKAKQNPAGILLIGAGIAALLAARPSQVSARGAYSAGDTPVDHSGPAGDTLHGDFDARVAAAEAAEEQPKSASAMRKALNTGLANLPEPARKRVVKAREAAIKAQADVERHAGEAARKARSLHQTQPWTTAALSFGIGAIAAAAVPRTKLEDNAMGEKRDALLQEAEFALRDELRRAQTAGKAALKSGLETARSEYS